MVGARAGDSALFVVIPLRVFATMITVGLSHSIHTRRDADSPCWLRNSPMVTVSSMYGFLQVFTQHAAALTLVRPDNPLFITTVVSLQ